MAEQVGLGCVAQRVDRLRRRRGLDRRLTWSMSTLTVAEALLPAASIASPVAFWAAPFELTTSSFGHTSTPESASEHV